MTNSSLDDRSFATSATPNSNQLNNPLSDQLDRVKKLLFAKDTTITLGQGLRLLFVLIRESLVLAWLAFCWAIVAISWLGNRTTQAGQNARGWWATFQASHQDQTASDMATEAGKSLLNNGKEAVDQLVTRAKQQVGLLDK